MTRCRCLHRCREGHEDTALFTHGTRYVGKVATLSHCWRGSATPVLPYQASRRADNNKSLNISRTPPPLPYEVRRTTYAGTCRVPGRWRSGIRAIACRATSLATKAAIPDAPHTIAGVSARTHRQRPEVRQARAAAMRRSHARGCGQRDVAPRRAGRWRPSTRLVCYIRGSNRGVRRTSGAAASAEGRRRK